MTRGEDADIEVVEIIERVSTDAVFALRRDGRGDLAVVINAGRDELELPDAVEHETGIAWTIMPRADALSLGREHTLEAGELLAEELPPGTAWVLVLGPEGAAAVKLRQRRPPSGVSIS